MEKETTEEKRDEMKETGSMKLDSNNRKHNVRLLTIIGEIEGHEAVSGNTKATKYEHLLPMLAEVEDSEEIDGLLILLNTMGGDVEAGLSIAEMIASISKPTVSLVLGGSHSIGVQQSLQNMIRTQKRITGFLAAHSHMNEERIEELMLNPTELVKDVGTLLEGEDAVREGLIDEVGGMSHALRKLHQMIDEK